MSRYRSSDRKSSNGASASVIPFSFSVSWKILPAFKVVIRKVSSQPGMAPDVYRRKLLLVYRLMHFDEPIQDVLLQNMALIGN
jgi:hypothetical protein